MCHLEYGHLTDIYICLWGEGNKNSFTIYTIYYKIYYNIFLLQYILQNYNIYFAWNMVTDWDLGDKLNVILSVSQPNGNVVQNVWTEYS